MKILFVQNQPALATALQLTLQNEGYELTFCRDGITSVSMVNHENFDLIIADLFYVTMDEVKYYKSKGLPVIVLSSLGQEVQLQEAFDLGVDDYLPMPISLSDMSLRVQILTRWKVHSLVP